MTCVPSGISFAPLAPPFVLLGSNSQKETSLLEVISLIVVMKRCLLEFKEKLTALQAESSRTIILAIGHGKLRVELLSIRYEPFL